MVDMKIKKNWVGESCFNKNKKKNTTQEYLKIKLFNYERK